jgi:hypothetical protein
MAALVSKQNLRTKFKSFSFAGFTEYRPSLDIVRYPDS